ncbi:MAG: oxygen-independent coproporphyrinogen-3 oxidase, partial [Paraglaciecola sp.]
MAGIYLHIPFCKQACHYCNFHFSTSLQRKSEMVDSVLKELVLQKDYLQGETIETIYFGGGTPSLLSPKELNLIFEKINQHYILGNDIEITLEANPDDLTAQKLATLASSPVNRLSIGIQSFFEKDLKFMNRAHNAEEAKVCVQNAKNAGFDNLTVDLIYGSPTTSMANWRTNLQTVFDLKISHISCYCLTVEPKTALDHFVKTGKAEPVDEEQAAQQFDILVDEMEKHGYDHYEISNFAFPDCYSKHNSSYWLGEKYLGIGPSAHSFNGISRQWNVANNAKYMTALAEGNLSFEKETLTPTQQYDEYVMTSLRTIWGCELQRLAGFDKKFESYFLKNVRPFLKDEVVFEKNGFYFLTKKGKLLA